SAVEWGMRALPALGLLLAIGAGFLACTSSDDGCAPGDTQACTCGSSPDDDGPAGSTGNRVCGAGHVFAPCKCGGLQPNQPGGGGGPPPDDDSGADTAPPPENPAQPRGPSGAIAIAAGTFTMGCDTSDLGCADDTKPTHDVTLSAFSLDETEVSQTEYNACVG